MHLSRLLNPWWILGNSLQSYPFWGASKLGCVSSNLICRWRMAALKPARKVSFQWRSFRWSPSWVLAVSICRNGELRGYEWAPLVPAECTASSFLTLIAKFTWEIHLRWSDTKHAQRLLVECAYIISVPDRCRSEFKRYWEFDTTYPEMGKGRCGGENLWEVSRCCS